jgi:hypothetical protein
LTVNAQRSLALVDDGSRIGQLGGPMDVGLPATY